MEAALRSHAEAAPLLQLLHSRCSNRGQTVWAAKRKTQQSTAKHRLASALAGCLDTTPAEGICDAIVVLLHQLHASHTTQTRGKLHARYCVGNTWQLVVYRTCHRRRPNCSGFFFEWTMLKELSSS